MSGSSSAADALPNNDSLWKAFIFHDLLVAHHPSSSLRARICRSALKLRRRCSFRVKPCSHMTVLETSATYREQSRMRQLSSASSSPESRADRGRRWPCLRGSIIPGTWEKIRRSVKRRIRACPPQRVSGNFQKAPTVLG